MPKFIPNDPNNRFSGGNWDMSDAQSNMPSITIENDGQRIGQKGDIFAIQQSPEPDNDVLIRKTSKNM